LVIFSSPQPCHCATRCAGRGRGPVRVTGVRATRNGGDGDDWVVDTGGGLDYLAGGDGDDELTDTIRGQDRLSGGDGNNQLRDTGDCQDFLQGGTGNVLLDGGAERDSLWGGPDNDTLKGGAPERLLGWSYWHRLTAGAERERHIGFWRRK
jgi:hypothetical protein